MLCVHWNALFMNHDAVCHWNALFMNHDAEPPPAEMLCVHWNALFMTPARQSPARHWAYCALPAHEPFVSQCCYQPPLVLLFLSL